MRARTYTVHAPALSLPEAVMLPALQRDAADPVPRNLILPDRRIYEPMPPLMQETAQNAPARRGSMAGRAILAHIGVVSAGIPGRE